MKVPRFDVNIGLMCDFIFYSLLKIRFIVSDHKAQVLNSWNPSQQSVAHMSNALALIGIPPPPAPDPVFVSSVDHGLQEAVSAMCECTDQQHEKRTSLNDNVVPVS